MAGRRKPLLAWPSGTPFHPAISALAFAVAKVAAESFPEVREAAYAAAALVGLSRVALGRHWISDVVAGAWLGYWIASATLDNPVPFWVWEW